MVGQTEQSPQPHHEPTRVTKRFVSDWQTRLSKSPFTARVAKAADRLVPSVAT